jgi:hypothetical protein
MLPSSASGPCLHGRLSSNVRPQEATVVESEGCKGNAAVARRSVIAGKPGVVPWQAALFCLAWLAHREGGSRRFAAGWQLLRRTAAPHERHPKQVSFAQPLGAEQAARRESKCKAFGGCCRYAGLLV